MFTKADIENYFMSEKKESLGFLIIGILGVVTAIIFFFFLKTNFHKGASLPLFIIGLLFGITGFTIYKSTDEYRKRNVYAYDMNPSELKNIELPRMNLVLKNFIVYKWVEIILFFTGIGLYFYFIRDFKNDFWRGSGIALAWMALLSFIADYFAEKRRRKYVKGIESFIANT